MKLFKYQQEAFKKLKSAIAKEIFYTEDGSSTYPIANYIGDEFYLLLKSDLDFYLVRNNRWMHFLFRQSSKGGSGVSTVTVDDDRPGTTYYIAMSPTLVKAFEDFWSTMLKPYFLKEGEYIRCETDGNYLDVLSPDGWQYYWVLKGNSN